MMNASVDVELVIGKVREVLGEIKEMGEQCQKSVERSPVTAYDAELQILSRLLEMGTLMMGYFFAEAGDGNMGKTTTFGGKVCKRTQRITKQYQSVFGVVSYRQWKYMKGGEALWPLDQKLNVSERQASYFVQEILTGWGTEMSFELASKWFMKLFKQSFSTRTIGELIAEAVAHDSSFTEHRAEVVDPSPPPEKETIQAVSFDGAGVPMRAKSRLADTGVKREALIGVVYEAAPVQREAEVLAKSLIDGLFRKRRKKKVEASEDEVPPDEEPLKVEMHPYYRASLENKEQMVRDLVANAHARRRSGQKQVVLLDGAHRLWDLANTHFANADAKILDIVHVVGYLELAASALAPKKEHRYAWLVAHLTWLLQGNAPSFPQYLRNQLEQGDLSSTAAENLQTAITYIENHLQYMHYDEYLRHGYPIGTGVVESACKQLVRQRLDQAGARWHLEHAEAMLKLRAMQRSNDEKPFLQWHQNQEYLRLHTPKVA